MTARSPPIIQRQYAVPAKKPGDPAKLAWSTASSPDPTPNRVATRFAAWQLTALRPSGFAAVLRFFGNVPEVGAPVIRRTAGRCGAAEYATLEDAAPIGPRGLQAKVLNVLAFPDDVRSALEAVEQFRRSYQTDAAHASMDVFAPEDSPRSPARLLTALCKSLEELVFTTFPRDVRDKTPAVFGS